MMYYEHISHEFKPVYDKESRVLILGTFPSVKSREQQFYYGHPQNRFWKMLAEILEKEVPQTIEEKREFLLQSRIAVWDVRRRRCHPQAPPMRRGAWKDCVRHIQHRFRNRMSNF